MAIDPFANTSVNGQNIYGTAGWSPGMNMEDLLPGMNINQMNEGGVMIGGQPMQQVGSYFNPEVMSGVAGSQFAPQYQNIFKGVQNATYDPTYGWVIPKAQSEQLSGQNVMQTKNDLATYLPFILAAGMGAGIAGGAFGGAGLGAEAGGLEGITSTFGSYEAPTAVGGAFSTAPDYASLFGPGADVSNATMAGTYGSIPVDTSMAGATSLTGAVPSFSQSVGDAFGADSLLSGGGASGFTIPPGTSSAISRLLNGTATTDDYVKLAGTLGSTALGAFGANQSANAYKDVASQYLGLGAPFRGLLGQSYQPGFSMGNEPGYKDALDQSTNAFLRQASAGKAPGVSGGNPMENPGAWGETLKYVTGNTALPALQNYRAGLAGAGQLGVAQSGPAALGGAQASGGIYDALGYGLNSLVNPQTDLQTLAKILGGGGNNIFTVRP